MKKNNFIKLAILLSMAVVLNYIESLFPLPLPIPGVKLGIANFLGLIVLIIFDEKSYISFNILKVLLVAILRVGFGTSFLISFMGMALSTIVTIIIYRLSKASLYGLSLSGAIFHSVGQIMMVALLYSSIYMINYLPILMISSSISGILTAMLAIFILKRLPKSYLNEKGLKNVQ